ncbi:hypothetical protein QIT82_gp85 [Pseudomonas phage psageK9]|uniref:Uncharacterized protein n=1 Tax=Pseudomonas phage psageK9 TaxID=2875722 RepID=A0AAE9BSV5_9CAUD|nr:hypothetical protein QIT82_gp85 [Pseudomonas phage psageK9]UAW53955.1 hypothetical protein psageK9_85 [Pseudomonas phage psageK9]
MLVDCPYQLDRGTYAKINCYDRPVAGSPCFAYRIC